MKGKIIGRGKTARVYKVESGSRSFAKKEFSPIQHVKVWNWFFYHSPHPLNTEAGHKYAYWKRRVAHRLCKYLESGVRIPDALDLTPKGFITEFVEGRRPLREEKKAFRSSVGRLERFFAEIGMPTWSFSRKNPFAGSNFLVWAGKVFVIDYEQSVPVPDLQGRINYDTMKFDQVSDFIRLNRRHITDKLGGEEAKRLDEAFHISKQYHDRLDIRPRNITKVVNLRRKRKGKAGG